MKLSKELIAALFISLVSTLFGVMLSSFYGNYSRQASLSLILIEKSLIFERPESVSDLSIQFRGENLEQLARFSFRLTNSGSVPIKLADFIEPITIDFMPNGDILDLQINRTRPINLGMDVTFILEKSHLTFTVKLLNPSDFIEFSVLSRSFDTSWQAQTRVVGVQALTFSEAVYSGDPKRIHWSNRFLAVILFFLGVFMIAFFWILPIKQYIRFRKFDESVRLGYVDLPNLNDKLEINNWMERNFSMLLSEKEKARVLTQLQSLSEEDLNSAEFLQIIKGMHVGKKVALLIISTCFIPFFLLLLSYGTFFHAVPINPLSGSR